RGLREERYAVDAARDGETALYYVAVADYDVIILDVMLPKRDGLSVCCEVRRAGITTPILMLTARDAITDRVRGLDMGADDYLVKPFELSELFARLRALIRRSAGQATPAVAVGPVVIDPRTRTVTRDGEPVRLTAREYALVEL